MLNEIEQLQKSYVFEEGHEVLSFVDKFLQGLSEERQKLLSKLTNSEYFGHAANIVRDIFVKSANEADELRAGAAGYLFEVLSYLYLSEQLAKENKILLSPNETLKIYYKLYPERKKTVNRFGLQRSIQGITVPDGIIFDLTSGKINKVIITAACEYSLSNPKDAPVENLIGNYMSYFVKDVHQITGPITEQSKGITDYIRSKHPLFPSNARYHSNDVKLVLASPIGDQLPFDVPGVEDICIPVHPFEFRYFVDSFMLDAQLDSPLR